MYNSQPNTPLNTKIMVELNWVDFEIEGTVIYNTINGFIIKTEFDGEQRIFHDEIKDFRYL